MLQFVNSTILGTTIATTYSFRLRPLFNIETSHCDKYYDRLTAALFKRYSKQDKWHFTYGANTVESLKWYVLQTWKELNTQEEKKQTFK